MQRRFYWPARVGKRFAVIAALAVISGNAWGDSFIFNASFALGYLPENGGHYNYGQIGGALFVFGSQLLDSGIIEQELAFGQGYVPENSSGSPLPCVSLNPGYCYNTAQFFAADDGALLWAGGGSGGISVFDDLGDLFAVMYGGCTSDAMCSMYFFSGIGGEPFELSQLPDSWQPTVERTHQVHGSAIGVQDGIAAIFYDGSVDHFKFVLTPEPRSIILSVTVLAGFVGRLRRMR